ncbi:MAG: hypothetical protein H7Y88_02405, partial [Phycisphaerales bacterium]|nr:hypothetical protein [Phycisphaerales bacterium]
MEERQTNIKVGAGLDESRLNQDFIDFLKKWSMPVLLVILAGSAAMLGLRKWGEYKAGQVDQAFLQLDQAEVSGKPENLLRVAEEHSGQRAIPYLASLQAGDTFLKAARRRIAPGFDLKPDGTPIETEALLSDTQRTEYLGKAGAAYQSVFDRAKGNPDHALHTINALFGIAAVAEAKDDFDGASRAYTDIAARATAAGMPTLAAIADERRTSLTEIQTAPRLYAASE